MYSNYLKNYENELFMAHVRARDGLPVLSQKNSDLFYLETKLCPKLSKLSVSPLYP